MGLKQLLWGKPLWVDLLKERPEGEGKVRKRWENKGDMELQAKWAMFKATIREMRVKMFTESKVSLTSYKSCAKIFFFAEKLVYNSNQWRKTINGPSTTPKCKYVIKEKAIFFEKLIESIMNYILYCWTI